MCCNVLQYPFEFIASDTVLKALRCQNAHACFIEVYTAGSTARFSFNKLEWNH